MTLAAQLQQLLTSVAGSRLPVRIRAWDGSITEGDGPVVHVATPTALRRVLWRPGELGVAQAYIFGEIDVEGDLSEALPVVRCSTRRRLKVTLTSGLAGLRLAARHGALGPPPAAPTPQAAMTGRRHGRTRDKAAIRFHYDMSNDFYRLILDEAMVYSCGYWRGDGPGYGLAEAQRDKLDLVCRKLELRPGMRMLDVGCGWGALAVHAARHYGVAVVAVTLSQQQYRFARVRAESLGLGDRVTFRLMDYRDLSDGPFDAISTIEMGEHVGRANYPRFARTLRALLAPGGGLLVQQMSRDAKAPGGGAFIESYIAPDMHMRPVSQTIDLWEEAGFEIREVQSLREHYPPTVRCWLDTLEQRWDEAVALVGEATARIWRLYLVGGALAFEDNRMGVDQILLTAPGKRTDGRPPVPGWHSSDSTVE